MTLDPKAATLAKYHEYTQRAWRKGKLRYKLHSAQQMIYDRIRNLPPETRDVVVLCARRFGKSFIGTCMAIEDCLLMPGTRIPIIGPDIKQTTDIVVGNIGKIIEDAPKGLIKRTKSENRWKVGESELVIGGFDTATIESQRGKEAGNIYLEETGSSNPDGYSYAMRDVLSPQLLHTKGRFIHLTTLPPIPGHPFIVETLPKAQQQNAYFKYTIYDNPLLDAQQIAQAIADCNGPNTTAFLREFMCEMVRDEQVLVYPEYGDFNLCDTQPVYWNPLISIDFGGVRDKTVALLMTYDFGEAVDRVLDERVFEKNTSTKTIIETLKAMEQEWRLTNPVRFADASGMTHIDAHQLHAYPFSSPHKDDLDAAVNAVRVKLGQRKLKIHPRCTFLIQTLQSQQYNAQRTDFLRTEALGHNDAGMALTYGVRMLDRISNPFPIVRHSRDSVFTPRAQPEKLQGVVSNMGMKAFGSFRK